MTDARTNENVDIRELRAIDRPTESFDMRSAKFH